MWPDVRAESAVQLRRPANWLLLGVAAALSLTFGYAIPYAGRGGGSGSAPLSRLLPANFADTSIDGLPLFIGALALVFGVLVAGSDYGWQTWKTLLAQRSSRGAVLTGKIGTIAAGALILAVTLLALAAAASQVVAGIEGADASWPAAGEILTDLGAGWLIAFMWAMLGVTLAIALRAVALPVGIGLVWMLAVQNLISALAAPLLDWVDAAQQWLPGPAAGSLVASLGGSKSTPGVTELASQTQSWLVVVAYLIVFAVPAAVLLARRDLT
ncbi:MAG: ABC transporter permease subunit [Nocardiopsaceae bacterium]|jgi:ABC-type transport system involved in multi-copper enzyme maturation permease subunit|nr:ABC transporter permease subunit [Nocardiopsaceae bacterium]